MKAGLEQVGLYQGGCPHRVRGLLLQKLFHAGGLFNIILQAIMWAAATEVRLGF